MVRSVLLMLSFVQTDVICVVILISSRCIVKKVQGIHEDWMLFGSTFHLFIDLFPIFCTDIHGGLQTDPSILFLTMNL